MVDMPENRKSNKFVNDRAALTCAGIGITVVRSREGFRTVEAIKELALTRERPLYVWDCVSGWEKRTELVADEKPDKVTDPYRALTKIREEFPSSGIFAMLFPHWAIGKSPQISQILKNYSFEFPEDRRRLILIVPIEYALPQELEDEIAVLDFDVPTPEELFLAYDDIVEASAEAKDVEKPSYTEDQIRRITSAGQGITLQEFENAVSRTIVSNIDSFPDIPFDDFVRGVMKAKTDVV